MGQEVRSVLAEHPAATLGPCFDRDALPTENIASVQSLPERSVEFDVAIDFTTAAAAAEVFALSRNAQRPLVTGTTGLGDDEWSALRALAEEQPVVHAPNMSVGVNLLFHLAKIATALAGPDFDAELVEMHHRHKRDAPSGTAVRLAEIVREAKGFSASALSHGRSGDVGPRPREEIGVMTLRGGSVIGDHTLILAGEDEVVELSHRAGRRRIFARGAVRAANWISGKAPGIYGMDAVLGLTGDSREI